MPAPYSDDLYSADDSDYDDHVTDDNDLDHHLSPTDGYFQNSTSTSSDGGIYPPQQEHFHSQDDVTDATFPTSAGVPHVPNILVQDPSLRLQQEGSSTTSQKDREAREEARLNSPPVGRTSSSPATPTDDHHYYDGSSTAADSEATPSHTTAATTTAYTYTSSNAAQSSSSSYTPYAPSVDAPLRTPQTHPSRSLYSQPASLFRIPREAPPAYTPSPTSPLASSPTPSRNYQTFSSNMGAREEEARLLGRDPESMGDDSYDSHDPRPSPSWKDRVLKKFSRRTVKTALLVALVFFTLTGFLSMLATAVVSVPSDKPPSTEPPKELDPVTGQPIKVGPSEPTQPSEPNSPVPWNPSRTCLQSEYRFDPKVFGVSFNPDKTLSIIQAVESDAPSRGYRPQVTGDLVVRRLQGSAPGPSVELEVVANHDGLDVGVDWDSELQRLLIKVPQRIDWTSSLRPCLAVRATLWVPENAELSHLYLGTTHLGVELADDLSVTIKNGFEIVAISGDVHTPVEPSSTYRLGSRDIAVKTISGDITGSWPLYDSLKIRSESGDIHANVNPQPVLESAPRPAVLEVTSISGTISIKEPLDQAASSTKPDAVIPPRDYVTTLDAKSGGIRAWVAFTTLALAESISGDVAVELLPVFNISLLQSLGEPELHTSTKSGNVAIKMLEPIWVEIASTEGTPGGEKPRAKPDEPIDIPTNPLPVPNIPKIPRVPSAPFIPGIGQPFRRSPLWAGKWTDAWPVRRSSADASTQTEERDIMANDQPPMRLKSSHSTISGTMEIHYPASWEGSVRAESNSGKINIRGKGVTIDSRTTWPRAVHAHKGQPLSSSASLSSISGDQTLLIG
ncbi:hypothetical protein CGRA01v4_00522 [Colletotrichum graminicola]|uniref:Adhesin domain-containing protein n=1 Tax=Colletotrichum graminicola (strain M1.001 / M2 / FGSC 10212) TaxID=645133 RepID=E3QQ60_COLGM|nr:uncharacterized protein GLRG_08142 [Colletotrichum graminicola M1.001]EFQ32998.1 hypothetical protein GLRG_08142 [Colletotrichum graminicola M1.001]WDK09245.1 hypothetical protein CGRA01v4_00522 [Colletotrichum graminicola]